MRHDLTTKASKHYQRQQTGDNDPINNNTTNCITHPDSMSRTTCSSNFPLPPVITAIESSVKTRPLSQCLFFYLSWEKHIALSRVFFEPKSSAACLLVTTFHQIGRLGDDRVGGWVDLYEWEWKARGGIELASLLRKCFPLLPAACCRLWINHSFLASQPLGLISPRRQSCILRFCS